MKVKIRYLGTIEASDKALCAIAGAFASQAEYESVRGYNMGSSLAYERSRALYDVLEEAGYYDDIAYCVKRLMSIKTAADYEE